MKSLKVIIIAKATLIVKTWEVYLDLSILSKNTTSLMDTLLLKPEVRARNERRNRKHLSASSLTKPTKEKRQLKRPEQSSSQWPVKSRAPQLRSDSRKFHLPSLLRPPLPWLNHLHPGLNRGVPCRSKRLARLVRRGRLRLSRGERSLWSKSQMRVPPAMSNLHKSCTRNVKRLSSGKCSRSRRSPR